MISDQLTVIERKMKCFEHQKEEAVGICKYCGRGVCRKCARTEGLGLSCSDECEKEAKWAQKVHDNYYHHYPKSIKRSFLFDLGFGTLMMLFGVWMAFFSIYAAMIFVAMGGLIIYRGWMAKQQEPNIQN